MRIKFFSLKFTLIINLLFILQVAHAATVNAQLQSILLSQGYVDVPLRMAAYSNALLIDIKLNNGIPRTLILDTGAAFSTIEQRYANLLSAKLTGENKVMSGAGSIHAKAYQAIVPTVNLLGYTSHNESFYLSQKDFSYMKIDKHPIVGLLGLDYLMKHQAILDVAGQQLYLKTQDMFFDQPFHFTYKTIPLDYTPSGHVTIMASINNASAERFLLDTGVPMLMVSADYARTLGLKHSIKAITGKGSGGGSMMIFPAKIKQLTIGNIKYSPKQALITDLQFAQVGVPLYGVIGLDWMQANHAIIDMEHDVVYIH